MNNTHKFLSTALIVLLTHANHSQCSHKYLVVHISSGADTPTPKSTLVTPSERNQEFTNLQALCGPFIEHDKAQNPKEKSSKKKR